MWKTPTPEQVKRAIALLSHPEYQARFFARLQNPQWLIPLQRHGFFTNPPGSDGAPSGGPWPPSAYVARMAQSAPDEAFAILSKMKPTANMWVRRDLVDGALALHPNLAAQLVRQQQMTWLFTSEPLPHLLPENLITLALRLAEHGETVLAWRVARAVLWLAREKPDRDLPDELAAYTVPSTTRPLTLGQIAPVARFDTWRYGRLVAQNIPELVKASGKQGFSKLVRLLRDGVVAAHHGPKPDDYLHVGRPAIELRTGKSISGINGPVDALIDAVRDAAISLAHDGVMSLGDTVAVLEEEHWRIFQRLALHLLRVSLLETEQGKANKATAGASDETPSDLKTLIAAHLAARDLYTSTAVFHEYVLLARASFAILPTEAQDAILRLGDEAEHTEADEEGTSAAEYWRNRVFGAFCEVIPTTAVDRHPWLTNLPPPPGDAAAKNEEGIPLATGEEMFPIDRDFLTTMRSWVGPTSPRSLDDLRALTVDEIVAEIKNWTPPTTIWGPSPEGFARTLGTLVRERAEPFAREAEQFIGLPAPYVGHLLFGLIEALRAGAALPWEPLLHLCDWVVAQPGATPLSGDLFTDGDALEADGKTVGNATNVGEDAVSLAASGPQTSEIALEAREPIASTTTHEVVDTGSAHDEWEWARSNVARLIEASVMLEDMGENESGVGRQAEREVVGLPFEAPFELCRQVLRLLTVLTSDASPTPDDDRQFADVEEGDTSQNKMGPSGLALNSVRGAAFHALVRFALWMHRLRDHDDEPLETKQEASRRQSSQRNTDPVSSRETASLELPRAVAQECLQQVLALFDRHLDPGADPSLAVRSIYGQFFPWLLAIDAAWAAAHVSSIFPTASTQRRLRNAAWNAYLAYCQPYREVYVLLAEEYRHAVEALEPRPVENTGDVGSARAIERQVAPRSGWRLAEHLVLLYLRGTLQIDDGAQEQASGDEWNTTLFDDFLAHAPEPIRAHAIEYAGLVFQHSEVSELPRETRARAECLWDRYVAEAIRNPDAHRQEMAAFGDWYGSGRLDRMWALQHLRETFPLIGDIRIRSPHLVADRLVEDMRREVWEGASAVSEAEAPLQREGWRLTVMECLRDLLFKGSKVRWEVVDFVEPQAREILAIGHGSQEANVRRAADALIQRLGEQGFIQFGEIVK